MRILLVDDSKTIRCIQRDVLRQLGHVDVSEADDGSQALSRFHDQIPDLILVDWNMPNMDGLTFVRKIREIDKGVPIIMCVTEAEKTRVLEAVKAGASSYIVKPFTAESLGERIARTVGKTAGATS